ncbi:hypothetical protein, variant [Verruconis gallopava]|uniref:Mid2 domain-containing protein n=1 Tax=Verruconis gallopava TaxID=253628 RepID=A0A0D2AUN0_9PEZI|nr:uncharacterized protein PV09_05912 [Verruconis gallopava]XP_016212728.1 hypothetical protein, variant [Verruconis gallopava]KIW02858.1 hypothetical protein PV09_05912 [Verruconis gallopava]KIW02859.1 hypothetical protein, variant [Verruconis gallopava]
MTSLTRSMATLVTLPIFLPILVAAIPAAEPLITPPASIEKRANGANIIGYSLSGTSWRTRSCNNGFFSTIGSIGNCCVDSSCDFITTCIGNYIYYDSGVSSNCGNVCGTGTIFHTVGDQSPLSMFNCQSDWTVTETITSGGNTSPSIVTTTAPGSTVTIPNTVNNVQSTASAAATSSIDTAATSSNRQVTLTVTNSDGSKATSVSVAAAAASGTSSTNANTSTKNTNSSSHSSDTGAIVGGVVGGIAVIALIAGIVAFLLWKRRRSEATPGAAPTVAAAPNEMPPGSYAPAMQENSAWQQQNNQYGYTHVPQQPPYATQDYKMPLAGGGYANPPSNGPQMMAGTPANYGPQELAAAQVHAPVEMPSQPYRG